MSQKCYSRFNKLRHTYQLLYHIQINGFDESLWRRILLQGIQRCFSVQHIWSGLISDQKVECEEFSFDQFALSWSSHSLIQMCDQFKQRWARSLGHPDYHGTQVIQWISQMIEGQSERWFHSDQLRLEKLELAGREAILLTYQLNAKHLRCFLFEREPNAQNQKTLKPQQFNEKRLAQLMLFEMVKMIRQSRLSTTCYLAQPLSPREAQTGRYLLQGYTEKEIARQMYLSPHTIHTYIKSIYRQFGVTSRAQYTALFVSHVPVEQYFELDPIETTRDGNVNVRKLQN